MVGVHTLGLMFCSSIWWKRSGKVNCNHEEVFLNEVFSSRLRTMLMVIEYFQQPTENDDQRQKRWT